MNDNQFQIRKENLLRKAYPHRYYALDTYRVIALARQIPLPELTEEEIKPYRSKLANKKFKEYEKIEEQFQQIAEAINIIGSKIYDENLKKLNRYLFTFQRILITIEMNKESTVPYSSLKVILPIIRPEMQRFIAKYEELIKKEETETGFIDVKPENREGVRE